MSHLFSFGYLIFSPSCFPVATERIHFTKFKPLLQQSGNICLFFKHKIKIHPVSRYQRAKPPGQDLDTVSAKVTYPSFPRAILFYLLFIGVYLFIIYLLEHNCFRMLCEYLLYGTVNQLYVYIYPLWLESASHPPPPHPSRSKQSPKPSFLCFIAGSHEQSISQCGSVYTSILISQFVPLSSSPIPHAHVHSLCLCLYSYPGSRFICTVFLDSTYVR